MRTITKTFNIYEFDELDKKAKDHAIEALNDGDQISDHSFDERIIVLKKVAKFLDGELDYSISYVPNRGEYITIKPKSYEHDLNMDELLEAIKDDNFSLTGLCYEVDLYEDIKNHGLNKALELYIDSIHKEYEYYFTEEFIKDYADANEYMFLENGTIYID